MLKKIQMGFVVNGTLNEFFSCLDESLVCCLLNKSCNNLCTCVYTLCKSRMLGTFSPLVQVYIGRLLGVVNALCTSKKSI